MRTKTTFSLREPHKIKSKLLQWSQQFEDVVWLDSNNYKTLYSEYDAVLAVDGLTSICTDSFEAFKQLDEYQQITQDWLFGYLSYDLKNDIEELSSNNEDCLEFPELYFFQPKRLWFLKGDKLEAVYLPMVDDEIESDFTEIFNFKLNKTTVTNDLKIRLKTSKDSYFEKLDTILKYIHRGDIYETNFCQEFFAEGSITPVQVYEKLNAISQPPFASFLKRNNHYALCASPERYLKKQGDTLISQPIKGTSKRSNNRKKDCKLKDQLANDPKEQSENVMIVDLVRNDLSKTAKKGSVTVEELCKPYTFKQVHQLISTITSRIDKEDITPVEILKTTYPMGSMTGAPKVSAMKIIEELEDSKRGLYSGAIGYFTPTNDFDFNVVIRSILYNASKHYISYTVGGAITAKSIAEKEYEECLVKAKALRSALTKED